MSDVLKITDLKKSFVVKKSTLSAVNGISFSLEEGECLGLTGESGSGKSTAAQIIAGFVQADSGTMEYLGKNIDLRKKDFKSRIGMQLIFQDPFSSLNPKMKVKKILGEAALYLSDMTKIQRLERAGEVLELVRLNQSYLEKYPYQLSGGECQRVAIARALMLMPRLLICDEITSALDVSVRSQILSIIEKLKTEEKISILFITHDLLSASRVCDNVAVMHSGMIVDSGDTQFVLSGGSSPYTKRLIGSIMTVE